MQHGKIWCLKLIILLVFSLFKSTLAFSSFQEAIKDLNNISENIQEIQTIFAKDSDEAMELLKELVSNATESMQSITKDAHIITGCAVAATAVLVIIGFTYVVFKIYDSCGKKKVKRVTRVYDEEDSIIPSFP